MLAACTLLYEDEKYEGWLKWDEISATGESN